MTQNKNTVNVDVIITWPHAFYVDTVNSYTADSVARAVRRQSN